MKADIADIAKLMCANSIVIKGDQKTITGNPVDLARDFGLGKFVKALEKYIPEEKVSVRWANDGEYKIFK